MADQIVAVAAAQAADAGSDVVRFPGKGLFREIGVGDEGTGHGNAVRLAGGDDLLRLLGVEHRADRIDGDVHPAGALDRLRKIGVDPQRAEGRRHVVLQAFHADLHQVDVFLGFFQEADHILHREAALHALRSADPGHDQTIGTDPVPDRFEDHQGEAHAVFQAAAELIRSGVHNGGEELGREPAMAEMQEDGVKTGQVDVFRRIGILGAYFLHHFPGHGQGSHARIHRRSLHRAHRPTLVVFRFGLDPAVGQLSAGQGAVLMDRGGELGEKRQVVVGLHHFRNVVSAVAHRNLTQVHDRRAAPGLVFQIRRVILGRTAVYCLKQHIRRRHDPVFQENVFHAEGCEQMGKLSVHA